MRMKKIAALLASIIAANSMMTMPFSTSAADIKVEAESGTLTGTGGLKKDVSGYSGDGYMYLEDNADVLDIPVTVDAAGMYDLSICYQNDFGSDKIQNISINGVDAGQMAFPMTKKWAVAKYGSVKLNKGENTISIVGSWGWTNFDYITLSESKLADIKATQTNTCDADAIDSAKQLMSYLASVYGEHILSGQQEIYGNDPVRLEQEFNYIKEKTGKLPAIRGFDLGNSCNPITSCFGEDNASTRMADWAAKGGIVEASFHLNVPNDFASYTMGDSLAFNQTTYSEKTDFSPSKAIKDGTKENQFYNAALDKVADKLLALQEKGVPVMWRPLHEAEGGGGEGGSWFWWGREGSKAYRELYAYTYNYLTNEKGCHNLIWLWNSYNYNSSPDWYPGDQYVDIIGYDKYNCTDWSSGSPVLKHNESAISSTFYGIMEKYNSAKMVAMMENDSFSTVENLQAEKAGWLYFLTWYDGGSDDINFLSNPMFNTEQALVDMYTSDYCITLDELPKFSDIEVDPEATNPIENTQPTEPEEGHGKVSQDPETGNYKISLPKAANPVYLDVKLGDKATYATGALGASVGIGSDYYWVNIQWETTKSGEVEVDLVEDIYNITLENEEVTDEATIAKIKEALVNVKNFEGQIWWVGAGEDELPNSEAQIVDAYIKEAPDATEPTTTDPTPTETVAPTEGKTEPSEGEMTVTLYGDVDCNGEMDIVDVILLNKSLMIGTEITLQGKMNADVDNSDPLNPDETDALNILKACIKLVTLPIKD